MIMHICNDFRQNNFMRCPVFNELALQLETSGRYAGSESFATYVIAEPRLDS